MAIRLPTRPEVLSFIICDQVVFRGSDPCIVPVRTRFRCARLPTPELTLTAFFEVRLPAGTHEIIIEMDGPDGESMMPPLLVVSETAFKGGIKAGKAPVRVTFREPGWHWARLRVGSLTLERELCVLTPETRARYERPEA